MKLTFAWNVWDNYQDTLLGSEILRLENQRARSFSELYLLSQGGYPEPPSDAQLRYLDEHALLAYPQVPLTDRHPKFKGVFRVIEGIRRAYLRGLELRHDFVVVTNADAWALSIEKLHGLLSSPGVQSAAVAVRVGAVSGLAINYGPRVPLMDDHFIILNVKKCRESGVFDYDHSARFFRPHFGLVGGIHNILSCWVDQRVPAGLLHFYSDLTDTVGQYGDPCGWNLLPWQYQESTGFLHANCAQMPSLNRLRAAFLHDLGFTRYPEVSRYYEELRPRVGEFRRVRGVLCNRRALKRWVIDSSWRTLQQGVLGLKRARRSRWDQETLEYFDRNRHIYPIRLTG